jgi:uncharacterized protein (TIGR02001 family)
MRILFACAALVGGALAFPATAAELPAGLSVTGSVGLVSDYRFRGISLSDRDPALQGGITLAHDSGFYAGTWGSSIAGGDLYGPTEIDLFGGWSGDVAPGTTFDGMVAYYSYPGGNDAAGPADYFETTAKLTHDFGPVEATAGASYSWRQAALGDGDNGYVFADGAAAIPGTPVTLKGHAGYTDGALAPDGDAFDWSFGAETDVGPLTFGVSYVDTDIDALAEARSSVVFSLTASF